MAGGGPCPPPPCWNRSICPLDTNPKLLEFSLDLALEEDPRFDEVGPAGNVLWFLKRLEPPQVLRAATNLRYPGMDHDRYVLTADMVALERDLDDELSPLPVPDGTDRKPSKCPLIYPSLALGYPAAIGSPAPAFSQLPTKRPASASCWSIGYRGDKFPGLGRAGEALCLWFERMVYRARPDAWQHRPCAPGQAGRRSHRQTSIAALQPRLDPHACWLGPMAALCSPC